MTYINQEFLDRDFRRRRPLALGIPSTDELTTTRHRLLLPKELIQGKRILDLGSFLGITADWCLNNGVASYTGVEISPEFSQSSIELLNKYHSNQPWTIINQSLEHFFAENQEQFDIIYCWGVIHNTCDHIGHMRQLAQRADHIILQDRQPKVMWREHAQELSDEFWNKLEYDIPYQEWFSGEMTALFTDMGSVQVTASNSSIAAMRLTMEVEGFRSDLTAYEKLKQLFPQDFGLPRDPKLLGYYVIEFFRDPESNRHATLDQMIKNKDLRDKNFVDWTKL